MHPVDLESFLSIAPPAPRASAWQIFTTWLLVGLQSFGGGSSTFALINRACIQRGWLVEEEFVRTWALSQVSPGINLIKLTILIGFRLAGWPGLFAGVFGLLLPSAVMTILITAGFAAIRTNPIVQATLRGILPATIGLGLSMALQMALPLFTQSRKEGGPSLAFSGFILAAAAALMMAGVSPILVLLLAGITAMTGLALLPVRKEQAA